MREPYATGDRYSSHYCREVGSTMYCEKNACPYCGEDDE